MSREPIEAPRVTKPIQLLAAWLVSLIVLDDSFLAAARLITTPEWAPSLLVIAALLNVPFFVICLYILLTKFRAEMQEDPFYSEFLKDKLARDADWKASQVGEILNIGGLDIQKLIIGGSTQHLSKTRQKVLREALEELQGAIKQLSNEKDKTKIKPDSILQLAKGLMAEGQWLEAAQAFDEYVKLIPDDWEAQFSRGVSYGNARKGDKSDLAALRAYNETIALVPSDIDVNLRARLFSYRGAMLKRLRRLPEAEADLTLARCFATEDREIDDINYNLAGVYAMLGERAKLLEHVAQLRNARMLAAIRAHLGDYFQDYVNDKEFMEAIGALPSGKGRST